MTTESTTEEACYCCGQSAPVSQLARMLCHPEVTVCAGCAEWLATWSKSLVRAVPVLHTDDLDASIRFWEGAGFKVHRFDDDFASGEREGLEVHLVLDRPDGRDRGGAYIHARNPDAVHAAWTEAGLPVSDVRDEPWGMREFNVVDPGGNRVRIGRNI
jgi:catechol 2,3-dioxygenase-like lactoylglutathione lyase family enzyme